MNSELMFSAVMLLFTGILIMGAGLLLRHLVLQKIKNTPTSKIGSAAVGLVEVYGKVNNEKDMESPISKKKCVYWKIVANSYDRISGTEEKIFYHASSDDPFYIKDKTGKAMVEPKGGLFSLDWCAVYSGWIDPRKASIKGMLTNVARKKIYGVGPKRIGLEVLYFLKKVEEPVRRKFYEHKHEEMIVREYYIPKGSSMYVMGTLEKEGKVPAIKKGKHDVLFVSNLSEKKTIIKLERPMERWIYWGVSIIIIGLIVIVVSVL